MSIPTFDVIVVGGGIVGVAVARELARSGGNRVLVVEAENRLAAHQTGRNSGVIHAGLYYRPGSQKARLCALGREALYAYCERRAIPHRRCGKLVVASEPSQLAALDELERRARANGLEGVERLDPAGIRRREPAAAGIAGLGVPQTGVVDFAAVTRALADDLEDCEGNVLLEARVEAIEHHRGRLIVRTRTTEVEGRLLINCAGLHADRVARLAGLEPQIRLIPFRGEYYELEGGANRFVRSLIYPVPDPRFPFLGVHLTRTVEDRILAGPNAVPAGKREGYRRSDFAARDVAEILSFPGFWRLAGSYWRTGLAEMRRSLSERALAAQLDRLVPEISRLPREPAPSGVRAQAVDRSGRLLDDFSILTGEHMIHVLNAPSPAATAALAIGEHIAGLAQSAL
jgi:L-2-hydroxyglutarate oxidase